MSLHDSADPVVRYLWERAEARDENGEPEVAQALLGAAWYVEGLTRVPRVNEIPLSDVLAATRNAKPSPAAVAKLAREFYATAVAHTRSQNEANEAVDLIIQRLDDVLLGIRLGRRHR